MSTTHCGTNIVRIRVDLLNDILRFDYALRIFFFLFLSFYCELSAAGGGGLSMNSTYMFVLNFVCEGAHSTMKVSVFKGCLKIFEFRLYQLNSNSNWEFNINFNWLHTYFNYSTISVPICDMGEEKFPSLRKPILNEIWHSIQCASLCIMSLYSQYVRYDS